MGKKTESFSPKVRNMAKVSSITTVVQDTWSPSLSNQIIKGIKDIWIGKEVKLSLFTDDMMLHAESPKEYTPKLQELIQEFSKVARYKINALKPAAYLYTNNETEGIESHL